MRKMIGIVMLCSIVLASGVVNAGSDLPSNDLEMVTGFDFSADVSVLATVNVEFAAVINLDDSFISLESLKVASLRQVLFRCLRTDDKPVDLCMYWRNDYKYDYISSVIKPPSNYRIS